MTVAMATPKRMAGTRMRTFRREELRRESQTPMQSVTTQTGSRVAAAVTGFMKSDSSGTATAAAEASPP